MNIINEVQKNSSLNYKISIDTVFYLFDPDKRNNKEKISKRIYNNSNKEEYELMREEEH